MIPGFVRVIGVILLGMSMGEWLFTPNAWYYNTTGGMRSIVAMNVRRRND